MDRAPKVWLGVGAAAVISVIGAVILNAIGAEFEGPGEQAFEGITLLVAAGVLTWMIFWMQKQGRRVQQGLETDVRIALSRGQDWALFSLAFVAVVREGLELALFLTAANFSASAPAVGVEAPILGWLGGVLGLIAAALMGWLLFNTTAKLDLRRFFRFTGILLIVFAAGLAAHAVHEFNELGWVPAVIEHVYDVNNIVPESTVFGQFLQALFGYNSTPSLAESIGYVAYFVVIFFLMRWFDRRPAISPTSA
jgi:high-affinity iron transporter